MAETIIAIIDGMKSNTIACSHCAKNFTLTEKHLDVVRGYYPAIQTISKPLIIPVQCPECTKDVIMEIQTISKEDYAAV